MLQAEVHGYHVDLIVVGIALATVGSFTSGMGLNLMKASSRLERHKPLWRRYRWLVGVSLACWVNASLDVVAFALAPLAVIAPIGGVTIVASVLFARMGCAGEREFVSLTQWLAIFAVVGGVAIVDVFGPHPDPVLNTTAVLQHFHEPPFMLYQLAAFSVVGVMYAGLWTGRLGGPSLETTLVSALAGGMCSGITQTMMKAMATCAAAWVVDGTLPFRHVEFWIAVVELVVVALILLHTLNVCIASANLALSTPLYQVCVITFAIVAGCAFYGDLELATRAEIFMFALGVVSVFIGLGALILRRAPAREQLLATNEPEREPRPPPTAAAAKPAVGESERAARALAAEMVMVEDPDPDL